MFHVEKRLINFLINHDYAVKQFFILITCGIMKERFKLVLNDPLWKFYSRKSYSIPFPEICKIFQCFSILCDILVEIFFYENISGI